VGRNVLYTYRNLKEFNFLYAELERQGKQLYPFVFQETGGLLESDSGNAIDLSTVVEYSTVNAHNRYLVEYELRSLDDDNKVVIEKTLARKALEYFRHIFCEERPLYQSGGDDDIVPTPGKLDRKTVYTYGNGRQLEQIIGFAEKRGIPIRSVGMASGNLDEMVMFDQGDIPPMLDITDVVRDDLNSNARLIYLSQVVIESLPHTTFIVSRELAGNALESFRWHFDRQADIRELFPDLALNGADGGHCHGKNTVVKITDLDMEQLDELDKIVASQLIGHQCFKNRLSRSIRDFVTLNQIDEKRILAIFLLGPSGIGKTEVGRIISRFLSNSTYLAKINFGNYSSRDALNSLIGSPRGYIGCEHGELAEKVRRSKAG